MTAVHTRGAVASNSFPFRAFFITCLVVSVWVNASEVFRYFVFVMPMAREQLAMVPGVAPMNLPVFLLWGAWDTLLVALSVMTYLLWAARFGSGWRSVLASGTVSWLFFFVLFWVGLLNMGLASLGMLALALPLAWFEMIVASAIAEWTFARVLGRGRAL